MIKRACLERSCGTPTTGTRCPEHTRQHQRQRDLMRGTPAQRGYGAAWQRVRRVVLDRDGHVCRWCGLPANSVDHLLAKAHGGTDDLTNLVASCGHCNSSRGGRMNAR